MYREEWRALVNAVMNFWLPQNAGNFLPRCETSILSSSTPLREVTLSVLQFVWFT
jgi:hypothetical protein